VSATDAARAEERLAYSIRETAERMTLGESTVRRLVASGAIPSARIGGRRVVPADALDELLHPSREPVARSPHPPPSEIEWR
jgi:excisionase family DNA binding protein